MKTSCRPHPFPQPDFAREQPSPPHLILVEALEAKPFGDDDDDDDDDDWDIDDDDDFPPTQPD